MDTHAVAAGVIRWLEGLRVTEGPLAGERLKMLPFQRRFIRGMIKQRRVALSIARGNGKTTLLASLAACALAGPLASPRGQVVIVASSLGQARGAFLHAVWFLKPMMEVDGKIDKTVWRLIENSHECRLEHRPTGAHLRCIGSDPTRAHGLAPKLAIADEPAQWPVNFGPRMRAALRTSLGKQAGSTFAAIGTRPADEHHWFARMLEGGPGVYAQVHAAADGASDFAARSIRAANPAFNHFPALRDILEEEKEAAIQDENDLAEWRAYRLNKGTPEVGERVVSRRRESVMLYER